MVHRRHHRRGRGWLKNTWNKAKELGKKVLGHAHNLLKERHIIRDNIHHFVPHGVGSFAKEVARRSGYGRRRACGRRRRHRGGARYVKF